MTERDRAIAFNREIRAALRTVYDALNSGQRQKLLRNEQVKTLFDRYEVLTEAET